MRDPRESAAAIPLLLLTLFAAIDGCASRRLTFEKAGLERAELDLDKNECIRTAIGTTRGGAEILVPYCIDRESFIQCMEAHGYAVRFE